MATRAFHVLLVDDSEECQLIVRHALRDPAIELSMAGTLAEARTQLESRSVDLLLLDIGLPDGDGLSLLESPLPCPVFLFTGNEETDTKIRAFGLGADDYLTKPVNAAELKARVEMRLRKTAMAGKTLEAGPLRVDLATMRAFRLGPSGARQELDLTSKELKILCALVRHRGRVLSRPEIVREVWGDQVHVLSRTVDSHIAGLRRKLAEDAALVESLPQQGYRIRL